MANLRIRNGKWQAQVRRKGHKPRTRSFASKVDAQKWARQIEAELERAAIPFDHSRLEKTTIADLLVRYRLEVTPRKRGTVPELQRIERFLGESWAKLPLTAATAERFSQYRDRRLAKVQPGTVIRELGLLRSIFETGIREWGYNLPVNPIAVLKKPPAPEGRDRRLECSKLNLLLDACADGRVKWLRPAVLLAIETGMRRGELLNMRWEDIDFQASVLFIPVTKTGRSRTIPLSDRAIGILADWQPVAQPVGRVFDVSGNAFGQAWERLKARIAKSGHAQIATLRFHDLRHEAVSRFFELGLNTAEVATISGHRDLKSLFRYTHLKAENLVSRLRRPTAGGVAIAE